MVVVALATSVVVERWVLAKEAQRLVKSRRVVLVGGRLGHQSEVWLVVGQVGRLRIGKRVLRQRPS